MDAQTLREGEQYCVRWESEELGKLGDSLYNKLSAGAVGMCIQGSVLRVWRMLIVSTRPPLGAGIATTQVLSQTVLHSLLAAVAWYGAYMGRHPINACLMRVSCRPLMLINVADVIDNAWSRCQNRADRM